MVIFDLFSAKTNPFFKKIMLFFIFNLILCETSNSQILLTKPLLDSVLSKTLMPTNSKTPFLEVFKFSSECFIKEKMIISKVFITNRTDIPLSSSLYYSNGYYILVLFDNCFLSSGLMREMINKTNPKYYGILDSIKFPNEAKSGIVWDRLFLDIITLKRALCSKRKYTLKFTKVFPASIAPKELMPLETFSDGQYMVNPPYKFIYNNKGEMLEVYKKQLIPNKPVKIRMKKNNCRSKH